MFIPLTSKLGKLRLIPEVDNCNPVKSQEEALSSYEVTLDFCEGEGSEKESEDEEEREAKEDQHGYAPRKKSTISF